MAVVNNIISSSQKFGRNYSLNLEAISGETITITPPFTLEFDIVRNSYAGANVCKLRIYNLSMQTRNKLARNTFNQGDIRQMVLKAGYGNNIAIIFVGNIHVAHSVREGVNFITTIEAYDGGFAIVNGEKKWEGTSFPAGTPFKTVCQTIAEALPNVTIGAISDFNDASGASIVTKRANTYSGNPAHLLYEITGGGFYINQGKAYVLQTNEYVVDNSFVEDVIVVSSDTGLLSTPVLQETVAAFDMIFQPNLDIGRLVMLTSTTYDQLNGLYLVKGVKHRGIISPVVSGDAITTGEFLAGDKLTPVQAMNTLQNVE